MYIFCGSGFVFLSVLQYRKDYVDLLLNALEVNLSCAKMLHWNALEVNDVVYVNSPCRTHCN